MATSLTVYFNDDVCLSVGKRSVIIRFADWSYGESGSVIFRRPRQSGTHGIVVEWTVGYSRNNPKRGLVLRFRSSRGVKIATSWHSAATE